MSSTRRAPPGSPLRPERFASSPEFKRGLSAHLVAKRIALLSRAEEAALIWALHGESHAPGGLDRVASELWADCPECRGKPNADLVIERWEEYALAHYPAYRRIRARWQATLSLPEGDGEREAAEEAYVDIEREISDDSHAPRLDDNPSKILEAARRELPDNLARLCLDPAVPVADGWPICFPWLCSMLRKRYAKSAQDAPAAVTHTELSRAVWRALDSALTGGGLSVLTAAPGIGLTYSAKTWCDAHPGRAVHFEVPAGQDLSSFFRALAGSLGEADGLAFKAIQLRERCERVLETGQRILIVDRAKNLFPSNGYRYGFPERLEWLLADVVGRGVGVVLLADNSLWTWLGFIEKRTGWDRGAFVNRARVCALPLNLSLADVEHVARAMLPEAETAARRELAKMAFLPPPLSLHRLHNYAKLALAHAGKQGRERVSLADVQAVSPDCQASARALGAGLALANATRDSRTPRAGKTAMAGKLGRAPSMIVSSADVSPRSTGAPAVALAASDSALASCQAGHPADDNLPVAGQPRRGCRRAAVSLPARCPAELVAG